MYVRDGGWALHAICCCPGVIGGRTCESVPVLSGADEVCLALCSQEGGGLCVVSCFELTELKYSAKYIQAVVACSGPYVVVGHVVFKHCGFGVGQFECHVRECFLEYARYDHRV